LLAQRERAVNEYSKAKQTNDNTGGAQLVAEGFLKKAYAEGATTAAAPGAGGTATPAPPVVIPPPTEGNRPVLKKRTDPFLGTA
jgi:hypothetical protein